MMPTIEAGTLSSTIITRFSVPTSSTSDMPTDDLKQRQAQQPRQRQIRRRRIRETAESADPSEAQTFITFG